jgi:hypothetical protein
MIAVLGLHAERLERQSVVVVVVVDVMVLCVAYTAPQHH